MGTSLSMAMTSTVHWFRNDLRLDDNRAVAAAVGTGQRTHFLYVLDPELLGPKDGATERATGATSASPVSESPVHGAKRRAFLADCLRSLHEEILERGGELTVIEGSPRDVVPAFAKTVGASLVTFGRDYSPLAIRRDAAVARGLAELGIQLVTTKDRVIFEANEVRTGKGDPFRVFTPYKRAWQARLQDDAGTEPLRAFADCCSEGALPKPNGSSTGSASVRKPAIQDGLGGKVLSLEAALARINPSALPALVPGGEAAAKLALERFVEAKIGSYTDGRNLAAEEGTSRLSPYLRFGVISPRRCLAAAREALMTEDGEGASTWLNEIVWRDFYIAVMASFPHVLSKSFRPQTEGIRWDNDEELFLAWCEGRTGYPFVDAGMRQLVAQGWMHNRARMVTASFLVKDLLVDWRLGERFFDDHLIDGDPASNNGGWQWCASTGTDAQPYFRIFNPTLQGKRFDAAGDYVRRWIPELRDVPTRFIHEPWKAPEQAGSYPSPVVDHGTRRLVALQRFKAAEGQYAASQGATDKLNTKRNDKPAAEPSRKAMAPRRGRAVSRQANSQGVLPL